MHRKIVATHRSAGMDNGSEPGQHGRRGNLLKTKTTRYTCLQFKVEVPQKHVTS